MNHGSNKRLKRKRDLPLSLIDKVSVTGGPHGFGLDDAVAQQPGFGAGAVHARESGVHGNRSTASYCSTLHRIRLFDDNRSRLSAGASVAAKSQASSSSAVTRNPYRGQPRRSSATSSSFASFRAVSKLSRSGVAGLVAPSASHIVCAISENLARETCVASIDAGSPVSLSVTKQSNGQTYAETLAYLEVLQPHEVLLNEGRRNSQLAKKVLQLYKIDHTGQLPFEKADEFAAAARSSQSYDQMSSRNVREDRRARPSDYSTVVKFISRAYFDQTKGAELLQRVVREETFDASCSEEYILLSSTYALLHYTQQCLGANFAKNSIHLTVNSGGNNRMTIDRSTVFQLELLANARTGKSRNSLIGTIDCTTTTVGGRLLRANLMSPPTRVETINTRLDLVDAFLGDEEFFYSVLGRLQTLPDIDKMLSNIALVPWKKTNKKNAVGETDVISDRVANKGISALVCVKSTLAALPALADVLADRLQKLEERQSRGASERRNDNGSDSPESGRRSILIGLGSTTGPSMEKTQRHHLLRAIISTMRQPKLAEVLDLVSNIFTESTSFSRNANAMRHHACFALKADSNGMMEVCRKAFLANVDDIYKLADEYAETYKMHVTVKHTTARGYFLSIPAEYASDLPQIFIQPAKGGKSISCTTQEVHSLNLRAQENVQDLLLMTHERIQEVLDVARSHYDAFAALSDAVALLDMCHSFADVVALSRLPWCRPKVYDPDKAASTTANREEMAFTIVNGRYAIDAANSSAHYGGPNGPGDFIPNDTFAPRSRNFTVITGINGSGKSTYLKQVAIIVLLAHCGSYVPAEKANIPTFERLCTRIGTTDDQEHNISTFLLEMKETAFICQNASSRSLILIDELGRATSNEDGVAIAWAVSEHLLKKQATTFFVTHYPQLCLLSSVYPAVQNQHLEANVAAEGGGGVQYTHRLSRGPCNLSSNYGVEMAETCGWPPDVLLEARRLRSTIETKLIEGGMSNLLMTNSALDESRQAQNSLNEVVAALKTLARTNEDLTVIRSSLHDILGRCNLDDQNIVRGIKTLLFNGSPNPTKRCDHHGTQNGSSDEDAEPGTVARIGDIGEGGASWSASSVSSLLTSDKGETSSTMSSDDESTTSQNSEEDTTDTASSSTNISTATTSGSNGNVGNNTPNVAERA